MYQSKNLQTLPKQCETYHDIAMTMTSFDIPVVTSSPDIDVTLTSSHADGMTTAPGGLTKSKEDTTEGVTAIKMPTPSKKYFFKVLFSIFTGYNCQVIFANLELNDSVTRTSDSQPRTFFYEKLEPLASSFTVCSSSSFSCVNENLAIDSVEYLCTTRLCT